MIKAARNTIKRTFIYDIIKPLRDKQVLRAWEKRGRPLPPPPPFKQRLVRQYGKEFCIRTLVETGTLFGDMVWATKDAFDRIFSIELDRRLYDLAKTRFSKFKHVYIVPGDSGQVLPIILANITEPCLFWLDAHAMVGGVRGGLTTPIKQELHYVLDHPITGHVVLIDDARLFRGRADYPTIEEVRDLVLETYPDWMFEVRDDIIRAHQRRR